MPVTYDRELMVATVVNHDGAAPRDIAVKDGRIAGLGSFAAGLAGLFFSALRAAGAAFRTGADGFDFAAIFIAVFLDFATALAMADYNPKRGEKMRALHHFEGFRASRETPLSRNLRASETT